MKRSYLKPVSAKQRKINAEWKVAREAALDRAGRWPECSQRGLVHDCEGGIEVHHIQRRSQGGTNDLDNLVVLCSLGHREVHANPARAYELGLLKRSGVA